MNQMSPPLNHYLPCPFFSIALLLLLLQYPSPTHSAHSARRYSRKNTTPFSSTQYDRSITTFSDDGRLLQVEYGMEASRRGKSVACLQLDLDDGLSMVCFAFVVEDDDEEEGGRTEKVHRIDNHCLLLTTGLSGDGRALAQAIRVACQRMRLSTGETPLLRSVAATIAEMQHELTRTGGARPFGVTATLVGVDPMPEEYLMEGDEKNEDVQEEERMGYSNSTKQEESARIGKPRLFQSEPGGIVEEYTSCAAGKHRNQIELALVELRKQILANSNESETTKNEEQHSLMLEEMINGVANVLFDTVKETKKIDIWMIQSDKKKRGNAKIRCAKYVGREDVESVKKLFSK